MPAGREVIFHSENGLLGFGPAAPRETADADEANNHWPRRISEERLQLQKGWRGRRGSNPMREAREEAARASEQDGE